MMPHSHSRRQFLRSMGLAMPALCLGRLALAETHQPLGVQLYTVRNLVQHDLPGVLQQIRKIGYQEVESYSEMYNRPASELRQMILDHGLTIPSGHFNFEDMGQRFDYAHQLGVRYIICPMLPRKMWNSLETVHQAADQFNRWGEKAQSLGMQFAFHNHNVEFQQFDTHTGLEILLERTDSKLVHWEMDCYWVAQAGLDPVAMLRKHRTRIRLLHLKDRLPGFPSSTQLDANAGHFTEIGTGTLDFKAILAAARQLGIHHYFVEQDETRLPPIESLQISYKSLRKILSQLG